MKRNIPRTILAVLAALGLLLLGCGGSREGGQQHGGSQESAQEPVAGEFVGFARDAQGVAGIAAVADPVPSEGGARDVKVYYCDGAQTAEWFRDSADGNSIDFTSDDGDASVLATLTEELVTGTITLADGRTLDFESAPANGLAGLYPSEVTERGFSGVSERTVQLESEKVPDGLVFTATLPSGESRRSDALKGDEEWTSGSYRLIVVYPLPGATIRSPAALARRHRARVPLRSEVEEPGAAGELHQPKQRPLDRAGGGHEQISPGDKRCRCP